MSSKSSMRIVLVDPLGDILFSGESLSVREGDPLVKADAAPDSSEAVTERCPATLRSAEVSQSGIFRTVSRESYADEDEDLSGEIRDVSPRRRIHAA